MRKCGWIGDEFHCLCGTIFAPNLKGVLPFANVDAHRAVCADCETTHNIEKFKQGYIAAMLWSSLDDNEIPLDKEYVSEDISEEAMSLIAEDCQKFWLENMIDIPCLPEQAGHDFWLTRQGHGAGFWDGDWPEHGDTLTEATKKYPELDVFVGDGKIYLEGGMAETKVTDVHTEVDKCLSKIDDAVAAMFEKFKIRGMKPGHRHIADAMYGCLSRRYMRHIEERRLATITAIPNAEPLISDEELQLFARITTAFRFS